jgi:hypothetical protein
MNQTERSSTIDKALAEAGLTHSASVKDVTQVIREALAARGTGQAKSTDAEREAAFVAEDVDALNTFREARNT